MYMMCEYTPTVKGLNYWNVNQHNASLEKYCLETSTRLPKAQQCDLPQLSIQPTPNPNPTPSWQ